MLKILLTALYFMLPAYFANMAPVIVRSFFKWLNYPLDFNRTIRGKPILGKNKTFRGLIFGIIFAIIIAYIQFLLTPVDFFRRMTILDYKNWLLIGFLMGFGALFGDAIKSFIKRRINIPAGEPMIVFDQIDYAVGAIIFMLPIIRLKITPILTILITSLILNVLINHISFYLKIRDEKW